jgi:fructose-1,6-bisphosphatase/inositol monophosphatase family enzyme
METDEVLALLRAVGEQVVVPRFRALDTAGVGRKRLHAPVTVADREAEALLTDALLAEHPGAVVLGEEAVASDPSVRDRFLGAEHAFTVDPVDGTRQFVRGSPDHAMMLAELRDRAVVRSWIWQPQHRRAYVAEAGAAAWADGRTMGRPAATPADALEGAGWLRRARAVLRDLDLTGTCCGVDYPRLAEGSADYALFWRPQPWDHAPGSLLLAETGGAVGALDGTPYHPQGPRPPVLVAARDRATYDVVRGVLGPFVGAVPRLRGR